MSFQIELDKYEEAYGHFVKEIRDAIQKTFAEEEQSRSLTQADIARELGIDRSVVSRRLNGSGNITLRSVCDLYVAMGREPLANFDFAATLPDQDRRVWDDLNLTPPNTLVFVIKCSDMNQPRPLNPVINHEIRSYDVLNSSQGVWRGIPIEPNQPSPVLLEYNNVR